MKEEKKISRSPIHYLTNACSIPKGISKKLICDFNSGEGEVLPYGGCTGMYGPKGYMVFQPFWS